MRSASLWTLLGFLLAVVVTLVVWTRFQWGGVLLDTVIARPGRLEPGLAGRALLIRDEHLYASPGQGIFTRSVPEGKLVIPGTAVARVEGSQVPSGTLSLLGELDRARESFCRENEPLLWEMTYQGELRSDDLIRAVTQLKTGEKAPEDFRRVKDTAQRYWEWHRDWQEIWLRHRTLLREKARLEGWLESLDRALQAPSRGVVSFRWDGLEEILTLEGPYPTPGEARELVQAPFREVEEGEAVTAGQVLFRMVDPQRAGFYLVAREEETRWARVGSQVRLTLPSGEEVPALTEYVSPAEEGQVGLLFVTDRFLEDMALPRLMDVRVTTGRISGTLLPVSSVVVRGGQPGVWLWHPNKPRWQPVTVKGQVGDRVAVDGVPEAVSVVTNPRRLVLLGVR